MSFPINTLSPHARRNLRLAAAIWTVLALGRASAVAADAVPVTNRLLQAIRTAPDVSAAVEAYARAAAAEPTSLVDFKQSFVYRMLDLGTPELADAQAHDLVNRGAADATIRGVAAYDDALRGKVHAAVENLKLALTEQPDDPFLLRTAGQFVAWFDAQPNRSAILKTDSATIEWLRAKGKGRDEFADGYRLAGEARQSVAVAAGTQASPHVAAAPAATTQPASVESRSGTTAESTPYRYDYPYGYSYPYYGYGYGNGYGSADRYGGIISVRDADVLRALWASERTARLGPAGIPAGGANSQGRPPAPVKPGGPPVRPSPSNAPPRGNSPPPAGPSRLPAPPPQPPPPPFPHP